MPIEDALDRCTAALEKHSGLLAKMIAGGGGTVATDATPRRGPGRPPKAKGPSIEEVKVIAERVRDEKSRPEAIALLKKHGADKVASLDESKYAAFVAAAEVLLADDGDDDGDGEGDDSI